MFLLDDQNNVHEIQECDILCIEVSRPHIIYRTKKGKLRAPRTLIEFTIIYNSFGFIQVDKKKMVNLSLADKFERGTIYIGDCNYAVSRRNVPKVKETLDQMDQR